MDLATTLRTLKTDYCRLHTAKEDLFWTTKMGIADGDPDVAQKELAQAEIAVNRFLQDPDRLATLRRLERSGGHDEASAHVLRGWTALFTANVIESAEGRKLSESIVELEAEIHRKRATMKLGFVDPASGEFLPASSVKLALMLRTDPNAARRRAAFDGLRSIEQFALDAGYLEIVRQRNRLGRLLGYEDFYDWRVSVVERMSKKELFALLDDLAVRTEARVEHTVDAFVAEHGPAARAPENFLYLRSGDLSREIDPYFQFAPSFERWGRAFHALGIRFRGARLTLDLVDRKGKYENGFMHGPELAYFEDGDDGMWRPARINFTANAVPGQVGSGLRASETLFHEGGHAAHFSNILAPAPCFSSEFAPTSVAYAETQSMFLDSLLGDADFRVRYALDAEGKPMPRDLIERATAERQRFRGWEVRALLTIPLAERAIYEIPDAELTPDRVLETLRAIERRMQHLDSGIRPVLAVPHLLAGESSAYYHAYILAEMGVYQTRDFFLGRDGFLTDNPKVGPDLAQHYWAPGNAATHSETLASLTGRGLRADALVSECNCTVEEALAADRRAIEEAARRSPPPRASEVTLDAHIRVVHGREVIADTDTQGFEGAASAFGTWIRKLEEPVTES